MLAYNTLVTHVLPSCSPLASFGVRVLDRAFNGRAVSWHPERRRAAALQSGTHENAAKKQAYITLHELALEFL